MPSSPAAARAAASRLPRRALIGAAIALIAGLAIAWVDTRPNWDDTGITAGLLLISAAAAGQVGAPWWLAGALAVAPLLIAELGGNKGVLLAVPIAFVGAFAGAFLHRLMRRV
jgi:hypothetical protein